MYTVQYWSRRFDWMRLHRWAWDRQLLTKPKKIGREEQEEKQILLLLQMLLEQQLRKKQITYRLVQDGYALRIEFLQPMQILKQVLHKGHLPGRLQWLAQESSASRVLQLSLRDQQRWCASSEFLAFEQFFLDVHSSKARK